MLMLLGFLLQFCERWGIDDLVEGMHLLMWVLVLVECGEVEKGKEAIMFLGDIM